MAARAALYSFSYGFGNWPHCNQCSGRPGSADGQETAFARTPKYNVESKKDKVRSNAYRRRLGWVPWVELLIGTYFAMTVYYAVDNENYITVPFLILFVVGYWYTGLMSLLQGRFAGLSLAGERETKPFPVGVWVVWEQPPSVDRNIFEYVLPMKKLAVLSSLLITLSIGTGIAFSLERQPNSDYRARRQALANKTKGGYVLLFAPPEAEGPNDLYGYRPDDNFFYLTGWTEPGAALLIAAAAEAQAGSPARPYTEILFLPNRNSSQEQWTGPKLGPDNPDAPRITGFDHVEPLDNLRNELLHLLAQRATVYTDVPAYGETSNSTAPLQWLKQANAFPVGISFQDVRPMLSSLRTFKDARRNRTHPQSDKCVHRCATGGDARNETWHDRTRNFSFSAIRVGKARMRASSVRPNCGSGSEFHGAALL